VSLIALHRLDDARSILHMSLSKILLLEGNLDASLKEAQQEPDLFWRLCANAAALHSLGRRNAADQALQALIDNYSDVAPFQIAEIRAWRRKADEACRWLERA
jgi:hypothetical protein